MLGKTSLYKKQRPDKSILHHRISLRAEEKKFLEDFLIKDYNRKWARKRRLKYLINRLCDLTLIRTKQINAPKWFLEVIDEILKQPAFRESKKIIGEWQFLLKPRIIEGITDEMIETAKQFSIVNLLGEPTMNKYLCIFHEDKNPSMHYYPETNTVFCFSCGESADSIKIYQHLNNCNFIEAVRQLN